MDICICILYLIYFLAYPNQKRCIAQGSIAEPGQFPFYTRIDAPIKNSRKNKTTYIMRCGGSLIHPQWILTAAHCFAQAPLDHIFKGHPKAIAKMGIIKPRHTNLITKRYRIVIFHPGFKFQFHTQLNNSAVNDIALVKLIKRYKLNQFVRTIALPSLAKLKTRCEAGVYVGFGGVDWGDNTQSKDLHYGWIKATNEAPENGTSVIIPAPTKFYSRNEDSQGYPLPGDSGGPFVCYSKSGVPVQYGIIVEVDNTTDGFIFNAFEDVEMHVGFIREFVPEEDTKK